MKFLKIFAIAFLCLLVPAIGIVYYKYQTSMSISKMKPVKLDNGDVVYQTSFVDEATGTVTTYSHTGDSI